MSKTPALELTTGPSGTTLVVRGPFGSEEAKAIIGPSISEVVLNYAWGWDGGSVEFLHQLPGLTGLTIVSRAELDLAPIHDLHSLRYLKIVAPLSGPVDFSVFHELEKCTFHWIKGSVGLFELQALNRLWLGSFPEQDLASLSGLVSLSSLEIVGSASQTLHGIETLSGLKTLGLHNLKSLRTLVGIEKLGSLRELEVTYCPTLSEIGPVEGLVNLHRVSLSDGGTVASLQPVAGLVNLETLLFVGSTRLADGDLSVLLELPRLKEVHFQNRRHYSHKREAIQKVLSLTR